MPKRWGSILFGSILLGVGAINALRHYPFFELTAWRPGGAVSVAVFFIFRAYVFPDRGRNFSSS
jgi:hypothetical protein